MSEQTISGKSAATGRPHYFGRLYEETEACVWCGHAENHPWHFEHVPDPEPVVMTVRELRANLGPFAEKAGAYLGSLRDDELVRVVTRDGVLTCYGPADDPIMTIS